jgi:hypothetical protein
MQEFDDVYHEEIVKSYHNHELKRLLSARKDIDAYLSLKSYKTLQKGSELLCCMINLIRFLLTSWSCNKL